MEWTPLQRDGETFNTTGHLSLHVEDLFNALLDAKPEYARRAARWKHAEALEHGGELRHINGRADCLHDGRHGRIGYLAEESERHVHVRGIDQL
jgi:hypothetical protein